MKLIIAEKPSVAQTIANVVGANKREDGYLTGNGFMVSWCYGHLLTNASPEEYNPEFEKWSFETLPIVPDKWIDVPIKIGFSYKQLKLLTVLINRSDVESLIEATDAGREGELIFRRVYEYSGTNKPFERLWISSLEAASIRDGMRHLKPGSDYDNLYQAALARSRADWLFGINGTRFYTLSHCMGRNKATVGRVQTPTLAMIVARDREIENFKVTKRYAVVADFDKWKAETDKFENEPDAKVCLNAVKGKPYIVQSVETQKKSTSAPKLFSLTALQREMNTKYGFAAAKTLNIIQELYERKILSYPRTDAEYITSDMEESFKRIVKNLMASSKFKEEYPMNFHKVVNNNKVSDHYAIILTNAYSIQCQDVTLDKDEQLVVDTVKRRMIEAVHPSYSYNEIKVILNCNGYKFTSIGNEVLNLGWRSVAKRLGVDDNVNKKTTAAPNELPSGIAEGDKYYTDKVSVVNRDTVPPLPYTEATLLATMEKAGAKEMDDEVERKGLGTSATRAEIIEKLLDRSYIMRDKKALRSTDAGKHLIDSVADGFKSVDTTVEWENRLLGIEKGDGKEDCEKFCSSIESNVRTIIAAATNKDISLKPVEVGSCPWCTGQMEFVMESATCKSCGKKIYARPLWMEKNGKGFTAEEMKRILGGGKARGTLQAKNGKTYTVIASLDREKTENGQYAEWKFDFVNTGKSKSGGGFNKFAKKNTSKPSTKEDTED